MSRSKNVKQKLNLRQGTEIKLRERERERERENNFAELFKHMHELILEREREAFFFNYEDQITVLQNFSCIHS